MVDISKQHTAEAGHARDWRKSMSDHVAYALLVYTGITIFVTVKAMQQGMSSTIPYFALIVLVAAIIPACRWFEKRWAGLDDDIASRASPPEGFRRDTIALWALAIGLPLLLTGLFKAAFTLL